MPTLVHILGPWHDPTVQYGDLIRAVKDARAELLAEVDTVAETQSALLLPSQDRERWSVLDVLDHIERTERSIAALLDRLYSRARERGRLVEVAMVDVPVGADYSDAIPRYDAVPAFPGTEPAGDRNLETIKDSLTQSRARLLDLAERGSRWDCSRLVAPHLIGRLNFYEWLYLAAAHDRLHTEQVVLLTGVR